MTNNREADKPDQLETALLQNLRVMTPEAREELLELSKLYTELFPLRPVLRLIRTGS
jgi:hypothetical protein